MTIGCPDCGALQELPALASGHVAICRTCDAKLERTAGRSIDAALACAVTALILLFPANLLDIMRVQVMSMQRQSMLGLGAIDMWREGFAIPAVLILAFVVVLPFLRFGLLSLTLATVRIGARPPWLGSAFRWAMWLDAWSMPDVFLIAAFIGYSRVSTQLHKIVIEPGGWCFVGAALLCMISRASLDRRTIWRAIAPERRYGPGASVISCTTCDMVVPLEEEGRDCPRCGLKLRARKVDSIVRTVALLVAALAFYGPANTYPMSRSLQLGQSIHYRIIDGIADLAKAHLWPLAILVLCTSILIPVLKIAVLAWLALSTRRAFSGQLVLKSRLYRLVGEIGRWSCVDPFTVAVMTPLISFGPLARAVPGWGCVAFILVVVLTMAAARLFDPRLMWDARTSP